jgi:co-chaperonin GroES (HSP10)
MDTELMNPIGPRVLIEITPPAEQSNGGIVLTRETTRAMQDQLSEGKLIAIGQIAFRDMCPDGDYPPLGAIVRYIKYSGIEIKHNDKYYRLVNDEDVYGYAKENPGEN